MCVCVRALLGELLACNGESIDAAVGICILLECLFSLKQIDRVFCLEDVGILIYRRTLYVFRTQINSSFSVRLVFWSEASWCSRARACVAPCSYFRLLLGLLQQIMESRVTTPGLAVQGSMSAPAESRRLGPAIPTPSYSSGGGDGSGAPSLWSLPEKEQVQNLALNWLRAFGDFNFVLEMPEAVEAELWFARVVAKLREDPCQDNSNLEIDQPHFNPYLEGASSLHLAVLMKDLKMVQKILEPSVPDNRRKLVRAGVGDCKTTALHLAVRGGDSLIVDELLKVDADVNAEDGKKVRPLDIACRNRNADMLEHLLKNDRQKRDPIHVAAGYGDIVFMRELPFTDVNVKDIDERTALHYLVRNNKDGRNFSAIIKYLCKEKAIDMKALDHLNMSAFYVAVLSCNTEVVTALLEDFKDQIRLNEVCHKDYGPAIQIAFEGGEPFKDIYRALMECEPVKGYIEKLYTDRQVYVDAANAILVGAALIASVTFASWLQPPLNYTSYTGDGYSSSSLAPSTFDLNYVDVEHNIALRAFWVFNALSFYFAIGTVVCGARSVLPRSHLFIEKTVDKLRTNLLVTSILLACSVLFVIVAFAIAGTIVLTPQVKYQWCMIIPTIVGGIVCIISLYYLVKNLMDNYFDKGKYVYSVKDGLEHIKHLDNIKNSKNIGSM